MCEGGDLQGDRVSPCFVASTKLKKSRVWVREVKWRYVIGSLDHFLELER